MKEVKCECGHVNPHGTVLCEACGKVLNEKDQNQQLVDMRYEGSARRSQTYNKTIIDKIWNFFSSVKVGVVINCDHINCIRIRDYFSAGNVYSA